MRFAFAAAGCFFLTLTAAQTGAQTLPESVLRCFEHAGSPADEGLPEGMLGVAFGEINTKVAIAACIEAVRDTAATDPNMARIAYTLGRAHHSANEFAQAKVAYEISAQSGFALALNNLGALYDGGQGAGKDQAQAYKFFAQAGQQGLALGHQNAARMIADGDLGEPDWNKAALHWRALTASGDGEAAYDLASKIAEGQVAPLTATEQRDAYKVAADAGHLFGARDYSKWLETHASTADEQQEALAYAYQMFDIANAAALDQEYGWLIYQANAVKRIRSVRDRFSLRDRHAAEREKMDRDFPTGNMKGFKVPITCGEQTEIPFEVYVWDWSRDYPQTDPQAAWIEQARGCEFPQDVLESFRKLYQIAQKEGVSFTELAVYALASAREEAIDKEAIVKNPKPLFKDIPWTSSKRNGSSVFDLEYSGKIVIENSEGLHEARGHFTFVCAVDRTRFKIPVALLSVNLETDDEKHIGKAVQNAIGISFSWDGTRLTSDYTKSGVKLSLAQPKGFYNIYGRALKSQTTDLNERARQSRYFLLMLGIVSTAAVSSIDLEFVSDREVVGAVKLNATGAKQAITQFEDNCLSKSNKAVFFGIKPW